MAARPATPKELDDAWLLGRLDSPEQQYVIALDALAVVVSLGNPVTNISVATLRRIVSGRVRDWQEWGGKPGSIHVHAIMPIARHCLLRSQAIVLASVYCECLGNY